MVGTVYPGSPAAALMPGDRCLFVNGRPARDWVNAPDDGLHLEVRVYRTGVQMQIQAPAADLNLPRGPVAAPVTVLPPPAATALPSYTSARAPADGQPPPYAEKAM